MSEPLKLQRDDIISMLEFHFAGIDWSEETIKEATKDIVTELKKIADALRPFYACVHNDNGDVSIATGNLTIHNWITLDSICAQLEKIE